MSNFKFLNAYLILASIWMNKAKKLFLILTFERKDPDGSRVRYDRYIPLPQHGEPLKEIFQEELTTIGFDLEEDDIAKLHNQGIYNKSKLLNFGEEFELELQEYEGKWRINRIRSNDIALHKSSLSQEDVEALLQDIRLKESDNE